MLNGVINIDRSVPGLEKNYYTYFTTNFKGSLGNQPAGENAYSGQEYPSEHLTYKLWMNAVCWPYDPRDLNEQLTYREALETGTDEIVLYWLESYLDCMAQGWQAGVTQDDVHLAEFYDEIYANENSLLNTAIRDYENNCRNSQSLINSEQPEESNYAFCDPTEGAFERKHANKGGTPIQVVISGCHGNTPEEALINSNADVAFSENMRELGAPEYGGMPGNYPASASSILYPVIRFYRDPNHPMYPVVGCHWLSNVYQRTANPFFYAR